METPGSQTSLHRANLERVVRAVRMAGSLTQAEIARSTGLSAATVSNIVRELKDGGTVEVTPTSAGGRRARSVSLSGDAGIVIGVDFGHTHLRVAIGNLAHQVLAEESEPLDVDASSAEGFGRAEQLVNRLIETTGISPEKVIGVGLGVPGPIDVESGTLGSTSILPGWTGINPSQELAGPSAADRTLCTISSTLFATIIRWAGPPRPRVVQRASDTSGLTSGTHSP